MTEQRKCGFCIHPERTDFEIKYLKGEITQTVIAKTLDLHLTQVNRHFKTHCTITKEQALRDKGVRNKETGISEVGKDDFDMLVDMSQMKRELEEDIRSLSSDTDLTPAKRIDTKLKAMTELRRLVEAMIKLFELNVEKKKQESILTNLEIVVIPDKINKPEESVVLGEFEIKRLSQGTSPGKKGRGRPRKII